MDAFTPPQAGNNPMGHILSCKSTPLCYLRFLVCQMRKIEPLKKYIGYTTSEL